MNVEISFYSLQEYVYGLALGNDCHFCVGLFVCFLNLSNIIRKILFKCILIELFDLRNMH